MRQLFYKMFRIKIKRLHEGVVYVWVAGGLWEWSWSGLHEKRLRVAGLSVAMVTGCGLRPTVWQRTAVTYTGTNHGDVANYSCRYASDVYVKGTTTISCINGEWQTPTILCARAYVLCHKCLMTVSYTQMPQTSDTHNVEVMRGKSTPKLPLKNKGNMIREQ